MARGRKKTIRTEVREEIRNEGLRPVTRSRAREGTAVPTPTREERAPKPPPRVTKQRAQEMIEEIRTLKERLKFAQEGGHESDEEEEEDHLQDSELDREESDPNDYSYEEEEDEPESEDYSYEQGSRREKELLEEEQRAYEKGLGFGQTGVEPRSRTHPPRIILPSDESDNCPPGIELAPVMGDIAYEHMAEQLREMQKIGKERDLRLQKVEKEVRAQKGENSDDELEAMKNPLTERVLAATPPPGYVYAPMKVFAGTGDPADHIKYFNTITQAQGLGDEMKCKIFPSSLDERARRWFDTLAPGSIDCFSDLVKTFVRRYRAQKRVARTSDDLELVFQRPNEKLSVYLMRFNDMAQQIDDLPPAAAMYALKRGLNHEQFLNHLKKHKVQTVEDALRRAEKYINTNDIYKPTKADLPQRAERPDRDSRPGKRSRYEQTAHEPRQGGIGRFNTSKRNILMQVRGKIALKEPPKQLSDPKNRDQTKFCEYHGEHGHQTEDCYNLRRELDYWADKGELNEFLSEVPPLALAALPAPPQRQPNDHRGRGDQQGHRGRNHNDRRAQDDQPQRVAAPAPNPELPPARARLHVITRSAESVQNESRTSEGEKRRNPEEDWKTQPITFSQGDLRGKVGSRDGALVAELEIAGQQVEGILFDTGSEPNVLFLHAYERLQLNPALLRPCSSLVYGFNNAPTEIEGMIALPVVAGQGHKSVTILVDFLVVKTMSPYNAVLGRPFLYDLKGIISQAHMCVKFPTPQGVGAIRMGQRFDEWASRSGEGYQVEVRRPHEVAGSRKAARTAKRAKKLRKKVGTPKYEEGNTSRTRYPSGSN